MAKGASMKWTHYRPTKEGWYWMRDMENKNDCEAGIVKVRWYVGSLAIQNASFNERWPSKSTEWAGPIEEPTESTG